MVRSLLRQNGIVCRFSFRHSMFSQASKDLHSKAFAYAVRLLYHIRNQKSTEMYAPVKKLRKRQDK